MQNFEAISKLRRPLGLKRKEWKEMLPVMTKTERNILAAKTIREGFINSIVDWATGKSSKDVMSNYKHPLTDR